MSSSRSEADLQTNTAHAVRDAISFSAIFVWCGFQTGNFAQVSRPTYPFIPLTDFEQISLAIARLIESTFLTPKTGVFINTLLTLPKSDQASTCSLTAFLLGLATFGRLGDRIGSHKRGWLVAGTLIQAALTLCSAYAFWQIERRPLVSIAALDTVQHFIGVACLSASLGVQGIMARRLGTQFSTTSEWGFIFLAWTAYLTKCLVVLTAIFVELVADPSLFQVTRPVRSRDQKWLAVFSLFLGVVVGRLILGQLGTSWTIGVGVVIRIVIAVSWLFIPATHVHLP